MDKITAAQPLIDQLPSFLTSIADYTDVTGVVGIITVDFVESADIDPTTIPADTATFATKTSSAVPVLLDTPETGGQSLIWPDPAGGWNFLSLQASPSGFAYGYRVTGTAGEFCGCRKFPTAIPIDDADKNVVIGEVRLPVNLENVFTEVTPPG